jgi:SAM-dependent methyltransferase
MHVCNQCGFVFNAQFDPALLDYGSAYDNSQTCSAAFDSYLDGTVDYLLRERGVRQARIVEVGCGKGAFLRKLVADPATGNLAVGFDPSYLGPENEFSGRLRFVTQFFDGTRLAIEPDVVVCRHVIEHVEQPVTFLETIGAALKAAGAASARVFFETPCIEWILRNQVVWDFFYEHCSLFSSTSLAWTFRRAGFEVVRVKHLFGGQYLWLEANWSHSRPRAAGSLADVIDPGEVGDLAEQFAAAESVQLSSWIQETRRLCNAGRVALWGGGAKGVTFANLVDPNAQLIDCVVDVNPTKQGKFLPGTGHPLVAPSQLGNHAIATALVLNSNYVDEIRDTLRALRSQIAVVDLMGTTACKTGGRLA